MTAWINPDGTRWNVPDTDTQRPTLRTAGTWRTMTMPSGERLYIQESDAPSSLKAPPDYREFLRQIASRGGQSRAARHSRKQLATWGRQRGRKSSNDSVRPCHGARAGRWSIAAVDAQRSAVPAASAEASDSALTQRIPKRHWTERRSSSCGTLQQRTTAGVGEARGIGKGGKSC